MHFSLCYICENFCASIMHIASFYSCSELCTYTVLQIGGSLLVIAMPRLCLATFVPCRIPCPFRRQIAHLAPCISFAQGTLALPSEAETENHLPSSPPLFKCYKKQAKMKSSTKFLPQKFKPPAYIIALFTISCSSYLLLHPNAFSLFSLGFILCGVLSAPSGHKSSQISFVFSTI